MKLKEAAVLVLKGLRFGSPPRSDLVVYDQEGSDRLVMTALKGLEFAILPTRRERFYLSLPIAARMLKNLFRLEGLSFSQLFRIYLLSCVEHMRPKAVVTYIDNDVFFHKLSRDCPRAAFIAVQNGVKTPESMTSPSRHPLGWLPEPPAWGSKISMPELFCFGRHEEEIYKRYGHEVDRFHPVGSLVGGYYKSEVSDGSGRIDYDVLLVSQWREAIMTGQTFPYLKKGLDILHDFLGRRRKKHPLRFALALCSKDPAERDYFESVFGKDVLVVPFDREGLSTYVAMDRAKVVASLSSAAAYEAVGWGKKVFFCNFTGTPARDCPKTGFWSVESPDYPLFESKLDHLLAMDQGEFEKLTDETRRYLMNFDPRRPAHRIIRERLLECLGARS